MSEARDTRKAEAVNVFGKKKGDPAAWRLRKKASNTKKGYKSPIKAKPQKVVNQPVQTSAQSGGTQGSVAAKDDYHAKVEKFRSTS